MSICIIYSQRYEAKLDNLHRPDWPHGDVICATTPAKIFGKQRDAPDYCYYYVRVFYRTQGNFLTHFCFVFSTGK
jgi:hypothetical protein